MHCPFCKHADTRVIDSRLVKDKNATRRRRECEACKRRFTTYEHIEEPLPMVVKRDTSREAFDSRKIVAGMQRACEKRPVPADVLERLVAGIERMLVDGGEREVSSKLIGEAVMASLRDVDEVAYVRFASVYRDFRDVNEFMAELSSLLSERQQPKG